MCLTSPRDIHSSYQYDCIETNPWPFPTPVYCISIMYQSTDGPVYGPFRGQTRGYLAVCTSQRPDGRFRAGHKKPARLLLLASCLARHQYPGTTPSLSWGPDGLPWSISTSHERRLFDIKFWRRLVHPRRATLMPSIHRQGRSKRVASIIRIAS